METASHNPCQVYKDLNMFHLQAITRIFVKESVSTIQQNSNEVQTISLLDPKEIQKKQKTWDQICTFWMYPNRHKCSCS
jgi:isopentenyldiphosphate isomerase